MRNPTSRVAFPHRGAGFDHPHMLARSADFAVLCVAVQRGPPTREERHRKLVTGITFNLWRVIWKRNSISKFGSRRTSGMWALVSSPFSFFSQSSAATEPMFNQSWTNATLWISDNRIAIIVAVVVLVVVVIAIVRYG